MDKPRIHYVRWAPPALVPPPGPCHRLRPPLLGGLAPFLQRDYQLVALDLPGHGESDKPAGADYGLQSLGAQVGRLLDELGWEDCLLVGNSIGGGTCLSLTLQHPERVRALALLNSVVYREGCRSWDGWEACRWCRSSAAWRRRCSCAWAWRPCAPTGSRRRR